MLKYLLKNKKVCYKSYNDERSEIKSLNVYISRLAAKNFFDVPAYKKNISKYLGIKRNTPIYFNQNILLFSLKVFMLDEAIYLNYYAIMGVFELNEEILVVFKDSSYLKIGCTIQNFKKQVIKCHKIIDYLLNIKEVD